MKFFCELYSANETSPCSCCFLLSYLPIFSSAGNFGSKLSLCPSTYSSLEISPEVRSTPRKFADTSHLQFQPGVPMPPTNPQPNPFRNAFYGTGSGLIRGGLGAYGEKILGSSSEYVQSNISRYFSDPQYYFQVNDQYVRNKLKVVLFPFLHRGHWTRITEPVGGRLSYKPPLYDINAPDLYIPFMAFGTYVVLAGWTLGLNGNFSPEALNWLFVKGLLGWFMQVALLKVTLLSLGSGEAPLLDIVAYAGYSFSGMCLAVLGKILFKYSYYFLMPWACLCMGIFLVKTMKRVLFAEVLFFAF